MHIMLTHASLHYYVYTCTLYTVGLIGILIMYSTCCFLLLGEVQLAALLADSIVTIALRQECKLTVPLMISHNKKLNNNHSRYSITRIY